MLSQRAILLVCVVVAAPAFTLSAIAKDNKQNAETSAPQTAQQPWGVNLLRSDSLVGWDHGPQGASGWTIDHGRLKGQEGSTPLVGGWSLGDSELRIDWTASPAGKLQLELPKVPSGKGAVLALAEGRHVDLFTQGEKTTAVDKTIDATKDHTHSAIIKRSGDTLSLSVDGKKLYTRDVSAGVRFGLRLSVAEGQATITSLRLKEPSGESIFNGRDLTGWWTPGSKTAWQARDGVIVLAERGGNYLRTEKLYGNFTFSCEFKCPKGTNSGLGLRTARNGWPSGDGMELQIDNSQTLGYGSMMAIYRNVPPLANNHTQDDWNHLVVKADGRVISAWMNGDLVQHVNTAFEPELKHRHLDGWIGFQDHGKTIAIRNLTVLEAPAGLGMDAWYAPRPESAAAVVLDRLMNPERLSRPDGTRSQLAQKKLAAPAGDREQVVAELTGPAVLSYIDSNNLSGTLAFYFDGQQKPKIECPADQVGKRLPSFSDGGQPLITCLPFAESLKITRRGGSAAEIELGYVRFPTSAGAKDFVVETYEDKQRSLPRGFPAALDYRLSHNQYGTVREQDPYERPTAQGKTIAPGETVDLIDVDGAGLVHWLRMHGDKKHLATDDLWLSVTYDGATAPAILAPARLFFVRAAAGKNYRNYVVTDRGGPITRLAMPFGSGIRIALANRGKDPIRGVGLSASVERARDDPRKADLSRRMRLFGRVLPGGEGEKAITIDGPLRLVGLVTEQTKGSTNDLGAISLKGKDQNNSTRWNLGELLAGPGPGEFHHALAGRSGGLVWRYLLPAAIELGDAETLRIETDGNSRGALLYYGAPQSHASSH